MIGMNFFLSSCDFIHILCLWSIEIVSWMLIKFEMGRSWTVIIFPISMPCLCYIYVTCEYIIQLWKDFSVFPITTKDTRWVWLITRGYSLLHGTWSNLNYSRDPFLLITCFFYNFYLFLCVLFLNTVRYHNMSCKCV